MRNALIYSAILHVLLLTMILFGLPHWQNEPVLDYKNTVTVEIIPMSSQTNIKTASKKPQVKKTPAIKPASSPSSSSIPTPSKKIPPQKTELQVKPKPQDIPPATKEKAPLPSPTIKQIQKPAPEKKKVEKIEKESPKEATDTNKDDFQSVLKAVEQFSPSEKKSESKTEPSKENDSQTDFDTIAKELDNSKTSSQNPYNDALPLTISEKEMIKRQIMENWTIISGAKGAKDLIVQLHLTLARDGTVNNVNIVQKNRYNNDDIFRATADSAIRAIYKSSPLQNLPPEKYNSKDGWQHIELNFDPSDMFL